MSGMHLYSEHEIATTSVPNVFIDRYMVEANGEFVKVYLYLLRCLSDASLSCSTSAIADFLEHTEKDVNRALKYWAREGVIALELGEDKSVVGICLKDLKTPECGQEVAAEEDAPVKTKTTKSRAAKAEAVPVAEEAPSAPAAAATVVRKEYTRNELEALSADPDVTELLFIIETYLKHPLSGNDTNTILFWYDGLSFSSELISYLVEYCIGKGKKSIRYMDSIAMSWYESGIHTIEQAKAESSSFNNLYFGVLKAFGISGRNPIDEEIAFIDTWTKEFGFDLSIISEACARTIAAISQPNFKYANSILTSWHQNNVHTLADARKVSEATKPKSRKAPAAPMKRTAFTNFSQRDYNIEDLEAALLSSSPKN